LSEILPQPKTQFSREWAELWNPGSAPADVSGWQIDDGDGGGKPVIIRPGSIIPPGGYLAVELTGSLLNNGGDDVRLLRPDGAIADTMHYDQSAPDLSVCLQAGGDWMPRCAPTPGAPNDAPAPGGADAPRATAASEPAKLYQVSGESPAPPAEARRLAPAQHLPSSLRGPLAPARPYTPPGGSRLYSGPATPAPPQPPTRPAPESAPPSPPADAPPWHLALGAAGLLLVGGVGLLAGPRWRRRPAEGEPAPQTDEPQERML
jgi:hypothetical protein